MANVQWSPLARNYEDEGEMFKMRATKCHEDHPLSKTYLAGAKGKVAEATDGASPEPVADDPLAAAGAKPAPVAVNVDDPLSGALNDPLTGALDDPLSGALSSPGGAKPGGLTADQIMLARIAEEQAQTKNIIEETQTATPWEHQKRAILTEYTAGKIQVKAGFLSSAGDDNKQDARQELLMGNVETTTELSQKEYMDHIQKLHKELVNAWNMDEKVLSLKLAIQCAKLLADVDVPHFYPSMFVLVTEILDTFGTLVYDRIKARAQEVTGNPVGQNFSATEIPIEAKETCRNWFYKTACIRELLPRLFMEIALLRCFAFLADGEYPQILSRLSCMIRGLGDPMVAVFARCYLARGMALVLPGQKESVMSSFYDYLYSFKEFEEGKITNYLSQMSILRSDYLHLHSPAVEWLLKVIGLEAGKEAFTTVLQHYRGYCNNSMVLHHVVSAFEARHWIANALAMVALVKEASDSCLAHTDIFLIMAKKMMNLPPPKDQRLPILNEVWKTVTREPDLAKYTACCAVWIEFTLVHYSEREVMILLRDLVRHLDSGDTSKEAVLKPLESIVKHITAHSNDFGALLTSDYFIAILGMFKSERKSGICKSLLTQFTRKNGPTSDVVTINTLFDLARSLHDSIDEMSDEHERKMVATLICSFVDKIDFGQDLEQQLNVYVDCRAAFSNLDAVKDRLVLGVARLAMKGHRFMKGRHTKKTSAFVKACVAYCHITIPSIESIFQRLNLCLLCGQVALINQCLPQTDTFFKTAISLIPEVPETELVDFKQTSTEPALVAFLSNFCAALVVVPGHPEHGPFYLVGGLLKAIQKYPWKPNTGGKTQVYISLVPLLCAYSQSKLPYSIPKVESNDVLYGGQDSYTQELGTYLNRVVEDILGQLSELGGEAGSKERQGTLVLDLVNRVVSNMKLNTQAVNITSKLIELAARNKVRAPPPPPPRVPVVYLSPQQVLG